VSDVAGTFRDAEREFYATDPPLEAMCKWHGCYLADECPECEAAAEAAQPDTVKEAEGVA
jgi:hypothetical protein